MDRTCSHRHITWDADAEGGFRTDPCGRTGVVTRNGGLFCRLHDPERASAPPAASAGVLEASPSVTVRRGAQYGKSALGRAWLERMGPVVAVDPASTGEAAVFAGWRGPELTISWFDELGGEGAARMVDFRAQDKEEEMSNAERLRAEAERLLERAAKIEALPKEPKKGRYYALDVVFRTGPTVYRYFIVRAKTKGLTDTWASTGRNVGTKYWEELVNWRDVESAKLTRLRKDKS